MTKEQIEQRCKEQEQELLDKYFGNIVKEAALERPETIGDYSLDLPQRIEAEYRTFLAALWEEWRCQKPDETRSIDDILDQQRLRELMSENDRQAILRAHREAERRTLWERITQTNHKDVTYYKGLLLEYTRTLLQGLRLDFMEEVAGQRIENKAFKE
jgi:hypothetical protein